MARPTKYNPEYCTQVVKLMKKGHSKQFVAGKLGISRDTLYEWCRQYPEFSDTIKVGEMMSYAYWEEIGMKAMMGKIKGFRPSLWIFTMKARFGWRDNSLVKQKEDIEDAFEKELEKAKPQSSIAEIVEKYNEYAPITLAS